MSEIFGAISTIHAKNMEETELNSIIGKFMK